MDKKIFIITGILVLFFINSVSAIGITPGRTTVNFEPGLQRDISFSVVNTEHKDMGVVMSVRGELAEYITLGKIYAEFSSDEDSKSFSYSLKLPDSFEKPGRYEGEIVALEVPKGMDEETGANIGATVAVVSQLHVYVPYPDKYLEAEVNVIEEGDKINFVIPIVNRGKLDIVNAKATIDIYDGNDEKIDMIETNTLSLLSLERKELFTKWNANVNPGRYKAVVTLRYDNEVSTILKEFNVGEKFLEILEIVVRDFQLGGIAKFNALVENKWSSDLKDVYLNILVYNNEGEIMADFKSPTYDIDGLSKAEMVAYWDTAGVHEGRYDGKLMLKYGEKSTERNIEMKISQNNIEVVGLTGYVVRGESKGFNIQNIIAIAVAVLVVANIAWFIIIRRMLRKKK